MLLQTDIGTCCYELIWNKDGVKAEVIAGTCQARKKVVALSAPRGVKLGMAAPCAADQHKRA